MKTSEFFVEIYGSFLVASILLTLAPGPDIVFVATKSLAQGARAGIAVTAGLCSGLLFHATLAAFGISVLLRQSPTAFNAVKIAGAVYLVWLAVQTFRHRDTPIARCGENAHGSGFLRLYRTGALMSMLNPKVALFFLALLPQFVPDAAEHRWLNMLALSGIFVAQAFVVFSCVSLCAGTLFSALRERPGVSRWLNILAAFVFVAIAVSLLFF